jgi:hypothetical protein
MSENRYNPENKDIRFIDSDYKTLFCIPDGGYITITLDNGEQLTRQCHYRGECHVDVGTNLYHICEFAEKMECAGNTYAPCSEPEMVQGYVITDRMPVGDKVFVLAHNPNAVQKYVTWQGYASKSGRYDWGHYWSSRSEAWTDCFRRADAERTGRHYDHTEVIKQRQGRDEAR